MKTLSPLMSRAPWKENGMLYGSGTGGERVCFGAMMGRCNRKPCDSDTVRKLRLVRVPMVGYGCYDQGGAYWGQGAPLYCAFGDSETEQAVIWLRAKSRVDAKLQALAVFPNAKFFR